MPARRTHAPRSQRTAQARTAQSGGHERPQPRTTTSSRTTTSASPTTCPDRRAERRPGAGAACSGSSAGSGRWRWSAAATTTSSRRDAPALEPTSARAAAGPADQAAAGAPAAARAATRRRRRRRRDPRGDRRPLPGRRLQRRQRAERERHRPQRPHLAFGSASGVAEGVPVTVNLKVYDLNGTDVTAAGRRRGLPVALRPRGPLLDVLRGRHRRELPARRPGDRRRRRACSSPRSSRPATTAAGRTCTSRSTSRSTPRRRTPTSCAPPSSRSPRTLPEVYGVAEGYDASVEQPRRGQPGHRHRLQRRLLAAARDRHRLGRRGLHVHASTCRCRPSRQTGRVPSALPEGEPAPSDGSLPESALAGVGRAAVRGLRARAVLHGPLRLLRLQHLHRRRPRHRDRRARRLADDVRRRGGRGGPAGPAGARRRRPPVETVFFGGGTPTLLSPADLGAVLAAIDAEFGLAPGAEVTTEANPDSVTKADLVALREAGFNRISFGMQSAVDHVLTRPRPHPRPGPGARRRGVGARGRLRAGQPRPDLRHAGGVAGRLGGLARRRAGLRARPRLGVLPHRRGRHRAGPPGPPRRAADARRGRPRRQVRRSPTSGSRAAGLRLVRGLQLGPRRRGAGAGTTSSTGPAPTGGASARARTPTSAACGGGTSSTPRRTPSGSRPGVSPAHGPRGARRRDPAGRAGAAGAAAARRAAARRARRRPAGPRSPARSTRAGHASRATGWCSPRGAGCWPTRVVRDLLP